MRAGFFTTALVVIAEEVMRRNIGILFFVFVWIVGGCALNAQKKSTAKTAPTGTADQSGAESIGTGKNRRADSSTDPHQGDDVSAGNDGERGDGKKRSARQAPAALTIYFKANSNELAPSETAKLDKVAETLRRNPQARVTLTGYTDSGGSKAYNRMVAQGRASSVKFYLVAKGVDPGRMEIVAKGAREFAADNDTDEGRNLNRRVEIKILSKK